MLLRERKAERDWGSGIWNPAWVDSLGGRAIGGWFSLVLFFLSDRKIAQRKAPAEIFQTLTGKVDVKDEST